MKAQAAQDGQTIRIGGPVLSGYSAVWFSNLLTNPGTKDYVDFLSYHQYIFGSNALQAQWDSYNGNDSVYEMTQDPSNGPVGVYNRVVGQATTVGKPNMPIYITEFNTNWAFYQGLLQERRYIRTGLEFDVCRGPFELGVYDGHCEATGKTDLLCGLGLSMVLRGWCAEYGYGLPVFSRCHAKPLSPVLRIPVAGWK